jgi:5'(3')-deoxyribonucleotidase
MENLRNKHLRGVIAIDFDGTIVEHDFPHIGALKPKAKEMINELYKAYEIVIWTCRNNLYLSAGQPNYLEEARAFLDKEGIKYDRIDAGQQGKIIANYYIDDRGIAFKDNWPQIASSLLNPKN